MGDLLAASNDLEAFLTEWYGPPASAPAVIEGLAPPPLRHWYACAEAWRPRRLTHQNSVRPLDKLAAEDGVTVFYDENQGVCAWGYGPGEDPQVFRKDRRPGAAWHPMGETLGTFLRHVAVFEACLSGPTGTAARSLGSAPRQFVERCLAGLRPAPFVLWQWPSADSGLYIGDGALALSGPNVKGGDMRAESPDWYLFLAGKNEEALARFDAPGLQWDWDSRTGWM